MKCKVIFLLLTAGLAMASCTKNMSSSTSNSTSGVSSTIAVAADSAGGTDSIYVIQHCAPGYFRDSITASALPSAITSYLDTAYSGYSFLKGYIIKDSAGTVVVMLSSFHTTANPSPSYSMLTAPWSGYWNNGRQATSTAMAGTTEAASTTGMVSTGIR